MEMKNGIIDVVLSIRYTYWKYVYTKRNSWLGISLQ